MINKQADKDNTRQGDGDAGTTDEAGIKINGGMFGSEWEAAVCASGL